MGRSIGRRIGCRGDRRGRGAVVVALAVTVITAIGSARASAAPVPTQATMQVRTVTYQGMGARVHRASGELDRLNHTSRSFRRFVTKRLNHLWGFTNDDPACAKAPVVIVKRWRSDGFARISDEGVFGNDRCAQGGARAIYVQRNGRWSAPLGTQEAYYYCGKLRKYEVPVSIGGRHCYGSGGQVVAYAGP